MIATEEEVKNLRIKIKIGLTERGKSQADLSRLTDIDYSKLSRSINGHDPLYDIEEFEKKIDKAFKIWDNDKTEKSHLIVKAMSVALEKKELPSGHKIHRDVQLWLQSLLNKYYS